MNVDVEVKVLVKLTESESEMLMSRDDVKSEKPNYVHNADPPKKIGLGQSLHVYLP